MTTTESDLHHRIEELTLEVANLREALSIAERWGVDRVIDSATQRDQFRALQGEIKISRTMWDKMLAVRLNCG